MTYGARSALFVAAAREQSSLSDSKDGLAAQTGTRYSPCPAGAPHASRLSSVYCRERCSCLVGTLMVGSRRSVYHNPRSCLLAYAVSVRELRSAFWALG